MNTNTTTKGLEAGTVADSRCQAVDMVRLYALLAMLFSHAAVRMESPLRLAAGWDRAVPALDAWAVLPAAILHLASPTFALLTGVSLAFYVVSRVRRQAPASEIDGYLLRRGAMLLALGFFVDGLYANPLRWSRNPGILGMFGLSLCSMIPLRRLSIRVQFAVTALLAVGVQGYLIVRGSSSGASWIEGLLLTTSTAGLFPVLPWLPVILLGFAAGRLVAEKRVRLEPLAWSLGGSLLALWGVLWVVCFPLGFRKYPPSLGYLLPYLGLAFVLLALHDRYRQPERWWIYRRLLVLARCSLFFYIVHSKLVLNALAVLLNRLHLSPVLSIPLAGLLTLLVMVPLCRLALRWRESPGVAEPVRVPSSVPSFP